MAVNINALGLSPQCSCNPPSTAIAITTPGPTCISLFALELQVLLGVPAFTPSFYIGPSPEPNALAWGTIEIGTESFIEQPVWCIDYFQSVNHSVYSHSPVYTYDFVVANPSLVQHLQQPHRLNQIAYLINNIEVDVTVAVETNHTFPGQTSHCGTISSLDFQAVVWALVQNPGDCDVNLCLYAGTPVNICNVAYLWNIAFANVPDGSNYDLPTSNCSGAVYYPLVIIPEPPPDQETQVLLLAADINLWGISSDCTCSAPH